jgi:hypothetical protein
MRTTTLRHRPHSSGLQASLPFCSPRRRRRAGPATSAQACSSHRATFSVSVEENLLPGSNVFKDGKVVNTGDAGALPSA